MAERIPQAFIDDLLDRVDIVDVVGSRLDLRKSGKNYSARCPFHDEKTPSFSVSPDKQFFYCFGCGAGGNAIGFVMDYDRIGFPDAVESLAHRAGMQVPRTTTRDSGRDQHRKLLYQILEQADHYYRQQLRQHPTASTCIDYLKQRGLSGAIAQRFGLGFAPPGWDNLLLALGGDESRIGLLKETGMLAEKEESNRVYDRFRQRIMFPIRDTRGRTIGFGGRVLGDDKPKYLNSPETPLFHKGRELYGLYEAHRSLREIPKLLLVEGYMDVVALAQHGVLNAVATLGTAATIEQLDKLFRYTSEVVFCFDGDDAGRKAAVRALDTVLPIMHDGRSAKFLFLAEGEDPDSVIRRVGQDAFLALIEDAAPLSQFLFTSISTGLDLQTPDDRARLSTLAAPLIQRLPNGVFRQLLIKQLAERTGVELEALGAMLAPPQPPPPAWEDEHWQGAPPDDRDAPDYTDVQPPYQVIAKRRDRSWSQAPSRPLARRVKLPPVQRLIAILVHEPTLLTSVDDIEPLRLLELEGMPMLTALVELLRDNPEYTLNHILGYWRGVYGQEQGELLAHIAASDLAQAPDRTAEDRRRELTDILARLTRDARRAEPPEAQLQHLLNKGTLDAEDRKLAFAIWHRLSESEPQHESILKIKQLLADNGTETTG